MRRMFSEIGAARLRRLKYAPLMATFQATSVCDKKRKSQYSIVEPERLKSTDMIYSAHVDSNMYHSLAKFSSQNHAKKLSHFW